MFAVGSMLFPVFLFPFSFLFFSLKHSQPAFLRVDPFSQFLLILHLKSNFLTAFLELADN